MNALISVAGICRKTVSSTMPINSTLKIADCENSEIVNGKNDSDTCDDSGCDTQAHSAAVHALNILRALYHDSRLGEHIVPFIPEGVEIAVHGFSASLWPVSVYSALCG